MRNTKPSSYKTEELRFTLEHARCVNPCPPVNMHWTALTFSGVGSGIPGAIGPTGATGMTGPSGKDAIPGAIGYYGTFVDNTNQQLAPEPVPITFNTITLSQGIERGSTTSRIYVRSTGVFHIHFAAHATLGSNTPDTASPPETISIWFRKNGLINTDTLATKITVSTVGDIYTATWGSAVSFAANDFFELLTRSTGLNARFTAKTSELIPSIGYSGLSLPMMIMSDYTIPASPSAILTVTQVANMLAGPTGATGGPGTTEYSIDLKYTVPAEANFVESSPAPSGYVTTLPPQFTVSIVSNNIQITHSSIQNATDNYKLIPLQWSIQYATAAGGSTLQEWKSTPSWSIHVPRANKYTAISTSGTFNAQWSDAENMGEGLFSGTSDGIETILARVWLTFRNELFQT